jgi:hypothetical protein
MEHIAGRDRLRLLHCGGLVSVEGEDGVGGGGLGLGDEGRRLEREAAREQRDEGLHAHVHSTRAHRDIYSARVPEARAGGDVLVIGRVDEDRELDRLAIARQLVRDDLAGLQAAVVDRRADPQRAQVVGLQHELPARLTAGDDRGRFESGELALFLGGLADL